MTLWPLFLFRSWLMMHLLPVSFFALCSSYVSQKMKKKIIDSFSLSFSKLLLFCHYLWLWLMYFQMSCPWALEKNALNLGHFALDASAANTFTSFSRVECQGECIITLMASRTRGYDKKKEGRKKDTWCRYAKHPQMNLTHFLAFKKPLILSKAFQYYPALCFHSIHAFKYIGIVKKRWFRYALSRMTTLLIHFKIDLMDLLSWKEINRVLIAK